MIFRLKMQNDFVDVEDVTKSIMHANHMSFQSIYLFNLTNLFTLFREV